MPRYLSATVGRIISERAGIQRLEVGARRAYALTALVGPVAVGDEVILNVTATDLDLGTGGWDVVHWNLARRDWQGPSGGHVMKLRYTSLQADTGVDEEYDPEPVSLEGLPVAATFLHSQLAPLAVTFRQAAPQARLGWVMTDSAALPAALSDLAGDLRAKGLLHTTVSTGQAFGAEHEAVNLLSGFEAARRAGCDAVVAGPGPGVVGTGTTYGFSGIEVATIIDLAGGAGCEVVVALRWSDADPRPRHRGVSHHARTALALSARSAAVAVPAGYDLDGVAPHHRQETVDIDSNEVASLMDEAEVSARSMGRGLDEDPGFFVMAAAAGRLLASRAGPGRQP